MNIPNELRELKQKEFIDRRRRQQLREECEELRQLESKLRVAYVSMERASQLDILKEKQKLVEEEKARERVRVETERLKVLEDLSFAEQAEIKKKELLRQSLNGQLDELHKKKLDNYQELAEDRDSRNALQRKFELEQKEINLLREQQMITTRQDQKEFIERQAAHKKREKIKIDEETAKALKCQREYESMKDQLKLDKMRLMKQQQEQTTKLCEDMHRIEVEKQRREQILQELLQHEYRAKEDEHFRQCLEKEQNYREKTKMELQQFRNEYLARKAIIAKQKKDEIRECRLAAEEEAAKKLDEKQMLALQQQRRDHGSELMKMIEENRRKRAEALADTMQFYETRAKEEEERQKMIEEERIKMLSSLPPDVFKHLPNDVLREEDRPHLPLLPKSNN